MGDRDQLASVEAGSVLGDICPPEAGHTFSTDFCRSVREVTGMTVEAAAADSRAPVGLLDCIVTLHRSHRFSKDSGIGAVSAAVRQGRVQEVLSRLKKPGSAEPVRWMDGGADAVRTRIARGYQRFLQARQPQEALELLDHFKVLCAVNKGPYGVAALNALAVSVLESAGAIRPGGRVWYPGRPVVILRNDYHVGVFNGDQGVAWPGPGGRLYVYFTGAGGDVRRIAPSRLPEHDTAFAMTVHRSQGSEFDDVLLVLPVRDTPLLTRNLIYTGITRARKQAWIWARPEILAASISRTVDRSSGLRNALWGPAPPAEEQ
jgi:exodeoxyribonuclease V alpha subunit